MERENKLQGEYRMYRTGKKGWIAGILAVSLCLAAGCSNRQMEDIVMPSGPETETGMEFGVSGSIAQFAGAPEWKKTLQAEREGKIQVWDIKAKISLPDLERMVVAEVEEPQFDGAFREKVTRTLLDGPEIDFQNAAGEYQSDGNFEEDGYRGTRNGILCTVQFYESDFRGMLIKSVFMNVVEQKDIRPAGLKNEGVVSCEAGEGAGENLCQFSAEEAKKQALDLMESLGFSGWVCRSSRDLFWECEKRETLCYGYEMVLGVGFEGQEFVDAASQEVYWGISTQSEEARYSSLCYATVQVTDEGVVFLYVESPLSVCSVTEAAALLPLNSVQKLVENRITDHTEEFAFMGDASHITLNTMELVYFRVADGSRERRYSLIPAWRLADKNHNANKRHIMLINAMDGSIIDPYREL